jgi:septation ring formation regulator EzrA
VTCVFYLYLDTTHHIITDFYQLSQLVKIIERLEFLIQGVDKIMETLRNLGIEFVCDGYIERTSENLQDLYEAIPRRIEAVLKAEGDPAPY